MPELTFRKRLRTVELLLEGHSYQTISERVGVSKGTVSNVINEVRDGQLPTVRGLEDQVDGLREVATQVQRNGLSLSQAAVGLTAFRGFAALGIAPGGISKMVTLCHSMTPDGMETEKFARAVLVLLEAQERTGKGPEELEEWVGELVARSEALVTQCQELEPVAQQVETFRKERDGLVQENATLTSETQRAKQEHEKVVSSFGEDLERQQTQVQNTQKLIGETSRRYLDQEEKLRQVDLRLAEATHSIGKLADLGLPMEQLPDLAARLSQQAQHQGIDVDHFLEWFYFCLDGAGSLLGLESQLKAKEEQVQEADGELLAVATQRDAAAGELRGLAQQIAEAKATQRSIIAAWKQDMRQIAETVQQEISQGGEELRALAQVFEKEVGRRLVQLGETAVALGRLEEAIDSYALVRPLVSLLQGKDQLSLSEARVAAIALCRGLLAYLEGKTEIWDSSASVAYRANYLLEALEKWRP